MFKAAVFMNFKTEEVELVKDQHWKLKGFNRRMHGDLVHIASTFAIYRYIRHVDTIEKYLPRGSHILDWGSGQGQMSLLLKNRGYEVTAFDIFGKLRIYDNIGVKYVKGGNSLPFTDQSFDAVLSCGTLEHVPDDLHSLNETFRILKKCGYFFVFNLPSKYSASEFIGRHSKIGGHDHIYSKSEISSKLEETGYKIISLKHSHMLPTHAMKLNLNVIEKLYNKYYKFSTKLDKLLERAPVLNVISNEWEIVAQKR